MCTPVFKRLVFTSLLLLSTSLWAEEHEVLMLDSDPAEPGRTNVFSPALLFIEPGDTVTFVPTDKGHNSAAKRGMLPEGVERWNSSIDERFSIEFTTEGVYGYLCVPHYELGMVGLVIVGDDLANLAEARKVRHAGAARKAFRQLFDELDAQLAERDGN